MAAPARQEDQATPEQEAPLKPETSGKKSIAEIWKGIDMEAEQEVRKFSEETGSWWQRVKSLFKKAELPADPGIEAAAEKAKAAHEKLRQEAEAVLIDNAPVAATTDTGIELKVVQGGKAETPVTESSRTNEAFDQEEEDLKKEIAEAGGEEAWKWQQLVQHEIAFSKEYERLAQIVAKEGETEAKAWKEALKTGKEPEMTENGRKLNEVYQKLLNVRKQLAAVPRAETAVSKPAAEAIKEPVEEEGPLASKEIAAMKMGGEMGARVDAKLAEEDAVAAAEVVEELLKEQPRKKKKAVIKTSSEAPEASGEIDSPKEKIPSPNDVYPDLPKPLPGSRPPGVPQEEQPPAKKEKSPEAPAPEPAPAAEPKKEPDLDLLSKESMAEIVKKMDELGHADTYKKINTPEKLIKILGANGFNVADLGSVMEKSLYANWKKAQEKYNKERAKSAK